MNVVAHNILAMYGDRQLKISSGKRDKSTEKLSSGYRINRAADDAAGLSISEKMRKQIHGLDRASKNAEDGISMLQIADGALSETLDMMHRITELSIQSANGTNSESDRKALQKEVLHLLSEMDHISEETKFNEEYVFRNRGNGRTEASKAASDTLAQVQLNRNTTSTPQPGWKNPTSAATVSDDTSVVPSTDMYVFDADTDSGVSINGTSFPWSSISNGDGDTLDTLANGTYKINHDGLNFSFKLNDAKSLDDVARALNDIEVERSTVIKTIGTPAINSASTAITDPVAFQGHGFAIGRHTFSADSAGVSLDGGSTIQWNDILSGAGKTLEKSIEDGGDIILSFAIGASLTLNTTPGTTKEQFASAIDGYYFEVTGDGAPTVSGKIMASDAGNGIAYFTNTNLVNWTVWDDPKTDGALARFGYDQDYLDTNDGGRFMFTIANKGAISPNLTARFSMGTNSTTYKLTEESAESVQDIISSDRLISAGEQFATLTFEMDGAGSDQQGSRFSMSLQASRDTSGSQLFTRRIEYQASFTGIHEGYSTSDGALKTLEEGNSISKTEKSTYLEIRGIAPDVPPEPDNSDRDSSSDDEGGSTDTLEGRYNYWRLQVGADANVNMTVKIGEVSTKALGINGLDISTHDGALDAVRRVGRAQARVSTIRSEIGAQQNRLEHTVSNLDNTVENTQHSESRLRDTDVAEEVVKYMKENIVEQVGESMLAQANQSNNSVMNLLQA